MEELISHLTAIANYHTYEASKHEADTPFYEYHYGYYQGLIEAIEAVKIRGRRNGWD